MRWSWATSNQDKLQEIKEICTSFYKDSLEIIAFSSLIDPFFIKENGTTFQENALLKSNSIFEKLASKKLLTKHDIILSDDSGICVDDLGGNPGIYSARYSGGDDKDNLEKLLLEVANLPTKTSKAHYCACIGISSFYGSFSTHGFMYGQVIAEARGNNGFGYDPMFIPNGFNKTLAQLSNEEKNSISHRKIALKRANYVIEALLFR